LINRMTGHADAEAAPQRPVRQQPQVQARPAAVASAPVSHDPAEADQDRIEIPAFLRRQAN